MMVFSMSQYMVDSSDKYSLDLDNSTLSSYDKMQDLTIIANTTKTEVNNVKESPSVIDKLSSFFISGYTAFKTAFTSVDIVTELGTQGVEDLQLDDAYTTGIATIIIITIFIGIAIAAIFKWRV